MSAYKSYYEKLRDPRWQKRRLEVLAGAHWQCRDCKSTEKTLNVHHRVYRRGASPWEYADHELLVLCEDCHLARHELEAEIRESLTELARPELERVAAYVATLAEIAGDPDANQKEISAATIMRRLGILDALSGYSRGWDRFEAAIATIAGERNGIEFGDLLGLVKTLASQELRSDS